MFKILLCTFILFFLNGCATTGTFNENFVSKEIKNNLNKIEKTEICYVEYNNEIIAYKESHPTKTAFVEIDLKAGEINGKILNRYLSQYFSKVSNNCSKSDIKIESYIKDFKFDWNGFTIQGNVFITNQIKVFRNNQEIFNKEYKIVGDNKVILVFESFTQKPTENMVELYHRTLLDFYETEFKKDLLEVL